MTIRKMRGDVALVALLVIAGLAWDLLPGAMEPFSVGGMRYYDRVVVSGNITGWEMRETTAEITLFYDNGEHKYIVSSTVLDGEEYQFPNLPPLHREEEGESRDWSGNFWHVFLPGSSARSAFGRPLRLLCYILAVIAASVGWASFQKHRATNK